jgi:hypothetical protein
MNTIELYLVTFIVFFLTLLGCASKSYTRTYATSNPEYNPPCSTYIQNISSYCQRR